VGVILVVNAVPGFVRFLRGTDEAAIDRRLMTSALADKESPRHTLVRSDGTIQGWARHIPFVVRFSRLVQASGTGITVERALGSMAFLTIVAFLPFVFLIPLKFWPLSFLAAPTIGVGGVLYHLMRARRKRKALFSEQLPDAIDLIVRSLKVGHPFSGAMAAISRELPAPIGTEFGIAFNEVSYGMDITTAFEKMAERVPVPDLGYLTMAVQIQQESGGNLIEALAKLGSVIRDRFRMFRKVKAITAEGRFSAWFLSLFPVVLVGGVQLVKPDFYTQVMDFPYFPHLVVATVILLLINVFAMRVITNIKV
jgi:tight adherence protein B